MSITVWFGTDAKLDMTQTAANPNPPSSPRSSQQRTLKVPHQLFFSPYTSERQDRSIYTAVGIPGTYYNLLRNIRDCMPHIFYSMLHRFLAHAHCTTAFTFLSFKFYAWLFFTFEIYLCIKRTLSIFYICVVGFNDILIYKIIRKQKSLKFKRRTNYPGQDEG